MRSNGFPALALHIARKDWRESRRLLIGLTAGLFVPALLVRTAGPEARDFALGLLAGLLAGTGFGYAQYCFLNERQSGTLDMLLAFPVRAREIVLAKYVSMFSMVLVTVNLPAVLAADLSLLFFANAAALFLGTLFMSATVVSSRPWAFQLPVWGLLLILLPARQFLERYYPAGLEPAETLVGHPYHLAAAALLSIPLLVAGSVRLFSRSVAAR